MMRSVVTGLLWVLIILTLILAIICADGATPTPTVAPKPTRTPTPTETPYVIQPTTTQWITINVDCSRTPDPTARPTPTTTP